MRGRDRETDKKEMMNLVKCLRKSVAEAGSVRITDAVSCEEWVKETRTETLKHCSVESGEVNEYD